MRKRWVAVLAVVIGGWWMRHDQPSPPPQRAHVAVLADGFAVLAGKRVVTYDRAGGKRREATLRLDRTDARFVGTRGGAAAGWQDGRKVKVASVGDDGNVGDASAWGKNVRGLCDGAATNEHRFGIGWLESDGRVWVVHGPMESLAAEQLEPVDIAPMAKASWCGVASAEQHLVLLWRDGSRLMMNFCTKKGCSSLVVQVPIDPGARLLGYGCVRDSCLFATRDQHGTTRLHRVTDRRNTLIKTLDHATADTAVSIVGAGTGAFAIAYVAKHGRVAVQRITVDGALSSVTELAATQVPSLAWADGRLLLAAPSGDAVVVALPRS